MGVQSAKELIVYKKAYKLAMLIFEVNKGFPDEERYALTSQIRRSSRSVCMNLREAWAKRRYEAHFISKLTDCNGENNETDTSLDFSKDCQYINDEQHAELTSLCKEIGNIKSLRLHKKFVGFGKILPFACPVKHTKRVPVTLAAAYPGGPL